MPDHWGDLSRHTGWFTIQTLNRAMSRANPDAFMELVRVPDLPPQLAATLSEVRVAKFKPGFERRSRADGAETKAQLINNARVRTKTR